ncbi:MAG: photosynthetic complex assembly protein PuhC [Ideonella sp.]|nr:photosynthetic complex assembly protein PuhC [Ideonella sp.]
MNALPAESPPCPRGPLIAIAVLLSGVLIAVAAVRLSGTVIRAPDAPPVQSRLLKFEDRPDGRIAVIDARHGREVHAIVGEAGFVRGTLRGLARERKRMGGGPEQPFELVSHADGRLTLHDAVTGRVIDLDAFGPTNTSGFAALLSVGTASAPTPLSAVPSAPAPVALRTDAAAPTRTP